MTKNYPLIFVVSTLTDYKHVYAVRHAFASSCVTITKINNVLLSYAWSHYWIHASNVTGGLYYRHRQNCTCVCVHINLLMNSLFMLLLSLALP